MNWLLGLVGAFFGVVVADDRELLGAVCGFLIAFLFGALSKLKGRVSELERRLAQPAGAAAPAAATTSPPPAPEVVTPASVVVPEPAAAASAATGGADLAATPAPIVSMPAAATKPPAAEPTAASEPAPPPEPGWEDRLAARIRAWFTEGNVVVKVGVVVLLFAVAAALKYASDNGYFHFPIEVRLISIAVAALAGLGLGWRERERRPAFGLSLQGGAIGALLLTVFAAFRLYALLPPMAAFALIVVLVAGAALLSVLQANMWLAVLGFLGGYLAPVLISTGSANHVGLFTYYAVLNGAVFAISWRRSWRLLNLIGFAFTFGVGAAWGTRFYRPELFASVEPFLVLFFLFYVGIGLLYVLRQSEHRRPWVDGTLVFGTPLLAFPMQAGLLKGQPIALALSALAVAMIYVGLLVWLRRRPGHRLLAEAYGALALGFATLAVPLAFSAGTTAGVWALEGVGAAWLGLRQGRTFPWLAGLALQLLAAVSYCIAVINAPYDPDAHPLLLLNANWLGAAILAFAGFALSCIHDRHRPRFGLPWLLFGWATLWWIVSGAIEFDLADRTLGAWRFATLYLAVSVATAALLRDALSWPRLNHLLLVAGVLGLALPPWAQDEYDLALATATLPAWAALAAATLWALWSGRGQPSRSLSGAHLMMLWLLAWALTLHGDEVAVQQALATGWRFLAQVAPTALLTLLLWRRPAVAAWPRAPAFAAYRAGWFGPAAVLLGMALWLGLFNEGASAPLRYLPLLNPLELAWLAVAALLVALSRQFDGAWSTLRRIWPAIGFVFLSLASLRAVHHWHGEPWSMAVLDSGVSQTALTVVWSLVGVAGMLVGSHRRRRLLWTVGMVLLLLICAKLIVVDRHYIGNLSGIVSFMAVGLLMVGVGYFAPSPPRTQEVGT